MTVLSEKYEQISEYISDEVSKRICVVNSDSKFESNHNIGVITVA